MIGFRTEFIRSKCKCLGTADELLYAVEHSIHQEEQILIPSNMTEVGRALPEVLFLPKNIVERTRKHKMWKAINEFQIIPDGNRGAIIPDLKLEHLQWSREFVLGVKGIGARMKMYKDITDDQIGVPMKHEPEFYSESWFGENPWGAMSRKACIEDQLITELAAQAGIYGFYICPMVRATPLPEEIMKEAYSKYWYRQLQTNGPYYQELRLMPSDVRLFYQSEATLGKRTEAVLDSFNVSTVEQLDMFINNYITSGLAALTLLCRTLKHDQKYGYLGLDYTDVWLDKDSVIAPDGTIFFADLEGLEWVPVRDMDELGFKINRQFDRNFYEFMYGVDCLLKERDKRVNNISTVEKLRTSFAARLELAVEADQFIDIEMERERSKGSLFLILKPNFIGNKEFMIKILDFSSSMGVKHDRL